MIYLRKRRGDILEEDERLPILRVTIEKINLGTAFQRKYRVQYGPHLFKCYNIPTERILKFIKENKRELSLVSYIFTDRSGEE
jgi:hypothetical protein